MKHQRSPRRRKRNLTKRRMRKIQRRKQRVLEWTRYAGILVAVGFFAFLLVLGFGLQINVTGDAMSPTISNGDIVLVNRTAYTLRRLRLGNLIAVSADGNPSTNEIVRRVIGVAGDEVFISEGMLYINGEAVDLESMGVESPIAFAGTASSAYTVREDQLFVMGDHTSNSIDSRMPDFGMISRSDVMGRPWFVLHGQSFGFIR